MKVKSNYQWRQFIHRDEVPDSILESEFDHLNEDHLYEKVSDGFFQYKGIWYHVSNFLVFPANNPGTPWEGYYNLTAFNSVVLRVSDDGETYQVGITLPQ